MSFECCGIEFKYLRDFQPTPAFNAWFTFYLKKNNSVTNTKCYHGCLMFSCDKKILNCWRARFFHQKFEQAVMKERASEINLLPITLVCPNLFLMLSKVRVSQKGQKN